MNDSIKRPGLRLVASVPEAVSVTEQRIAEGLVKEDVVVVTPCLRGWPALDVEDLYALAERHPSWQMAPFYTESKNGDPFVMFAFGHDIRKAWQHLVTVYVGISKVFANKEGALATLKEAKEALEKNYAVTLTTDHDSELFG